MERRTELIVGIVLAVVCSCLTTTPGLSDQSPGKSIIITKVKWLGSDDAIEILNPTGDTLDFSGWYLGTGVGTEVLGVPGNRWSVLYPLEKRILRRGEMGSFTDDLEYTTVLTLFTPAFANVEQLGWSRADNFMSEWCVTRDPDTGGFHDGLDWLSSGGELDPFTGMLRYQQCPPGMLGTQVDVVPGPDAEALTFSIQPNPLRGPQTARILVAASGKPMQGAEAIRFRVLDVRGRELASFSRVREAHSPLLVSVPVRDLLGSDPFAGLIYLSVTSAGERVTRRAVVLP